MKKKIAHIQLLPILSGVQRISLSIFKGLDQNIYEAHLICAEDPFDREESLITEVKKLGVTVHLIKGLRRELGFSDVRAFRQILKVCRQEQFDIVHTHSSKSGLFGRLAAKMTKTPFIVHTIHGVAFHPYVKPPSKVIYYLLEMYASSLADKLISVNMGYRKAFWYAKKKLATIYNGIPFDRLRVKEAKTEFPISIVFVGRFDEQKDPLTLLKALNLVKTQGYQFKASLVGDGELQEDCQRYIDYKSMQDVVKLEGWRDDVEELLNQSDLYCSSSLYEALPLSVCEAGYSGLPCLGTDIIGMREVIVNSVTGYLYPPKDYVALAELIIRFIRDPKLIKMMGSNAHKFIEEHFEEERMVREYLELYSNN
ncbi:MAG: glycosyltransferase family 4 protein [Candidatus Zophobacter franzmannii]|nr:glycosyltransferase family 4 protein [Candidatus Zophobacter franzmannii]